MSEEDFNPYAAPLASLTPQVVADDAIWRYGPLLVTHRNASLPDRCVKCNAPAEQRRWTVLLYWHSPGIYWIFVLPLLTAVLGPAAIAGSLFLVFALYVVVALIARWRAVLRVGLCGGHAAHRRTGIGLAWALFAGGVTLAFYGCSMTDRDLLSAVVVALAGLAITTGGAIYGTFASRIVWPQKIDRTFAWIKGVSPEYLAELPELPIALASEAPFVGLMPPSGPD